MDPRNEVIFDESDCADLGQHSLIYYRFGPEDDCTIKRTTRDLSGKLSLETAWARNQRESVSYEPE
jgi:hypothetical protein